VPTDNGPTTGDLRHGDPDNNGSAMLRISEELNQWFPATFSRLHVGDSTTYRQANGAEHRIDYISLGGVAELTGVRSWVEQNFDTANPNEDHSPDYGVALMVQRQGFLYEMVSAAVRFATARIKKGIMDGKVKFLQGLAAAGGDRAGDILKRAKKLGLGGKASGTFVRPLPVLLDHRECPAENARDRDKIWQRHFGQQEFGEVIRIEDLIAKDSKLPNIDADLEWTIKDASPDSYRSIFISSHLGKSYHRLLRSRAMPHAAAALHDFHLGARRQSPVTFPALYIQGHLRHCRDQGLSSSVLFLDVQSAYYRVIRELSVGHIESDEAVCRVFSFFQIEEEEAQEFL
ncbi:unnamed protein product, partial [Symbiodinium sp. CCMP2456]